MSALTRRSIMESFMKLLDERPLNKISVKDIVEACGINRNTFYYHFSDIPDLVDAIVKDEAHRIMQSHPGISSLEECIEAATKLMVDHKRAVLHIYNSPNREIYERYLLEICEYVVTVFIDGIAARKPICAEDRLAIVDAYKCECLGHIINWLNHGMSPELHERFLRVCELRRGMTEELFDRSRSDIT
ncbi:MAG: TetR/AcrR family transcriptional regulator C-terminal domain-containing protein [Clostridia bacterium]|nr:TetR/AcrR family transcriptional regulator C-terminal domain-containing protein [Clostridia bacterium]